MAHSCIVPSFPRVSVQGHSLNTLLHTLSLGGSYPGSQTRTARSCGMEETERKKGRALTVDPLPHPQNTPDLLLLSTSSATTSKPPFPLVWPCLIAAADPDGVHPRPSGLVCVPLQVRRRAAEKPVPSHPWWLLCLRASLAGSRAAPRPPPPRLLNQWAQES